MEFINFSKICLKSRHIFVFLILFCYFNFGFCQDPSVLKAGTYVISQKAFDDMPYRYADFVLKAIQQINSYPLSDIIDKHSCKTSYWIWASQATKQITLVDNSLKILILPDGVSIDAKINTYISVPAKIQYKKKVIACFSKTLCNHNLILKGIFSLNVKFTVTPDKNGITIIGVPTLVDNNFDVSGCKPPSWTNLFVNIKQIIHNKLEEQIKYQVDHFSKKFNLKNNFEPYTGIFFNYFVTKIQFLQNDRILIEANSEIFANQKNFNGSTQLVKFSDKSNGFNLLPSSNWDLNLINNTLFQLQGVRVSSSLLDGFIWAVQTIGAFNTSYSTKFIDTTIHVNNDFSPPITAINIHNQLLVNILYGRIVLFCNNINGFFSPIFNMTFNDLTGSGSLIPTPDKIGTTIHIHDFFVNGSNISIDWPPLPISSNFVTNIEKNAVDHFLPKINSYFQDHPFKLPDDIVQLIPNPQLKLYNQPGCCDDLHGYLDFSSYCSMANDNIWQNCNFKYPGLEKTSGSTIQNKKYISYFQQNSVNGLYSINYDNDQCSWDLQNIISLDFIPFTTCVNSTPSEYILFNNNNQYSFGITCNSSCDLSSCDVSFNFRIGDCISDLSVVFFDSQNLSIKITEDVDPYFNILVQFYNNNKCSLNFENIGTLADFIPQKKNNCVRVSDYLEKINSSIYVDFSHKKLLLDCYQNCSACSLDYTLDTCLFFNNNSFLLIDDLSLSNNNLGFTFNFTVSAKYFANYGYIILIIFAIISFLILGFFFYKSIKINNFKNNIKKISLFAFDKIKFFSKEFAKFLYKILLYTVFFIILLFINLCERLYNLSLKNKRLLPKKFNKYTGCLIFSTLIILVIFILWYHDDTFNSYTNNVLKKAGISQDFIIETSYGVDKMKTWSHIIMLYIVIVFVLNVLLMIFNCFYKCNFLILIILFLELLTGFCIVHIPPVFIHFNQMIAFSPDVNSTMPAVFSGFFEPKIQYSFTGLGIASIANWNLFWLQGLLYGCISACYFFWITNKKNVIKQAISSIIGILIPLIIAIPLSSIVCIIFLYQSFNIDYVWLSIWIVWWLANFLSLFVIIVSIKYNFLKKKKNSINCWLIFLTYFCLHICVFAYAIFRESEWSSTNIPFAVGYWLLPIGQSFSFLFLIFNFYSKSKKNDYQQIQNNISDDSGFEIVPLDPDVVVSEQKNTVKICNFNLRIALYWTGVIGMAVTLFMTFNDYIHLPLLKEFFNFIIENDSSFNEKNGTALDPVIILYDNTRWIQLYINCLSFVFLSVASVFCFINIKKSKLFTRIFGILSILSLFIGLVVVASPNYLDSIGLDKYLPSCTPEFNKIISQSIKTSVGLVFAMFFTIKVSVLVLTFPPAIARASCLLLSKRNSYSEKNTLLWMWLSSPFFAIFMTIIPIIFVMQTIGDTKSQFIILIFWFAPLFITLIFYFLKIYFKNNLNCFVSSGLVFIWSLFYVGSMIALALYSCHLFNLWDDLIKLLWKIDFWSVLLSEFAISLIIPADLIEACIDFCLF